uniref:Muscle LIM protein Mlp84B n=1 Tax=Magallana gigas TaxID=29159 RepID=K1R5L1_MAGGI
MLTDWYYYPRRPSFDNRKMAERCPRCSNMVYFAEEIKALGKKWHKLCFKCGNCNKLLDSTTCTEHDGDAFCKSCYGKLFGPKGYGFAGGSSGLSMDTGNPHQQTRSNVSHYSEAQGAPLINQGKPKWGGTDGCPRCGKAVYFAEEVRALGKKFHKLCLACANCNKLLDSTTCNDHNNEIFCKACYTKNFGPKGYGFAGGASGLSMDTGRRHEVTTENVSHLAQAQAAPLMNGRGGSGRFGGGDQCPRCGKQVYFAEEVRALGKKYHKLCLRCASCNKGLDSTNCTDHHDNVYCKNCHGKLFGPKGYGFASGASGLSMDTGNPNEVTKHMYHHIFMHIDVVAQAAPLMNGRGGSGRFGGGDQCPRCGKQVYFAEEVRALGKKYHKLCLRCASCNKGLDSTNCTDHHDNVYCKNCHGKLFGPKGYGFASGASGLSMDTGNPNEVTKQNVSSYAVAQAAPLLEQDNRRPGNYGSSDMCGRCGKAVFFAEKVMGGGGIYHKACFNCTACGKKLDSTTVTQAEGDIFCKSCYGKHFGPKGFGFGQALQHTG